MGSSLVPIMLIVVLLVSAVVFVVLSSRTPRGGYEPKRNRSLEARKHRAARSAPRESVDAIPVDQADPAASLSDSAVPGSGAPHGHPEDILPGFGPPAWPDPDRTDSSTGGQMVDSRDHRSSTVSTDADGTGITGAGTGGTGTGGTDSGGRTTRMNNSRDPDATGWTPPPSGPPPASAGNDSEYRDSEYRLEGTGTYEAHPGRTYAGERYAGETSAEPSYPDPLADQTVPLPGGSARPSATDAAWDPIAPTTPPSPDPAAAAPSLVAVEPAQTTAPALRLAAAGRTRRGKRGGPNEDAFVVADGLLAVADGVGGEAAGQIASTLAVTTVAGFRPQYAEDPADGLRHAVARANQMVRERPREEPTWRGMACTLDVVVLGRQRATGETLTVAHVGDSSVWLQPQKGRPRQLTRPHAIKNGPLLNAVGLADEIDADILVEPVRAGDRVILASDGITKVMTSEQLYGLMEELGKEPPERAADALVEAALLAGARDDTTIVVGDLVPEPTAR